MSDESISARSATNEDCKRVCELVFAVLREYGLEPDLDGIDSDLLDIQANYIDRGGVFEVLEGGDGRLLGTVGLFPIDDETIELRKMYFEKEIRGRGLGKQTLRRMIDVAARKGYRRLTLETASVLKEAIGLYTSFGFTPVVASHAPRCDQSFYMDLK